MKKIKINGLDEVVYYEKLDNGLDVYLYNKDDLHSNYVTFTTKYGSIYNEFVPLGEEKMHQFPKGIAHFLEHKVFEQKEDPQPMEYFSSNGAVCNAYTTFKNTTYLFFCTDKLKENINYLLYYVQNIYLTDESVENEKNIISEEIHMYEDNPSSILEEKIRLNTLSTNPYRDSIIATDNDIKKITKDDLERCYHTFYHPSNMFLVVTGCFNPEEILNLIKDNQNKKEFKEFNRIKIKEFKEKDEVVKKEEIIKINTDIPKVAYTLKLPVNKFNLSRRKLHLYLYILFTILFDETSDFDKNEKDIKVINNTTYINLINCDNHILISFINETNNYDKYIEDLKKTLKNIEISENDFKRKKRVIVSNEIFAYENIETINDILIDNIIYHNKIETNPIDIINNLNMEEMNNVIDNIDIDNSSLVILKK